MGWAWLALALVPTAACAACPGPVAIDVGHTLAAPGATSARGVSEFTFNQALARDAAGLLTAAGQRVVVIGESGAPLALLDRTRIARAEGAALFVSFHHDSVQPHYLEAWTVDGRARIYSDRFSGFSVFTSALNPRAAESERLAAGIGQAMVAMGFKPSLHHAEPITNEGRPVLDAAIGLYRFDGLAVLRTASMPAALLEAGIIVNRADELRLMDPAIRHRIAQAAATAITRFCAR